MENESNMSFHRNNNEKNHAKNQEAVTNIPPAM